MKQLHFDDVSSDESTRLAFLCRYCDNTVLRYYIIGVYDLDKIFSICTSYKYLWNCFCYDLIRLEYDDELYDFYVSYVIFKRLIDVNNVAILSPLDFELSFRRFKNENKVLYEEDFDMFNKSFKTFIYCL